MTTIPEWREEPITRHHDRQSFDCGDAELNTFLHRYARQNHDAGGAKTFLAVSVEGGRILGYYSLGPASVAYERVPDALGKGAGKYELPVFRLARLAVDRSLQGQGLGSDLVVAAGRRCLRAAAEVGGAAILIDAKNERVASWYESFGALRLLDTPLSLLLSLKLVASAIEKSAESPR